MHHFAAALGAITLAIGLNNIFDESAIFDGKYNNQTGYLSFLKVGFTVDDAKGNYQLFCDQCVDNKCLNECIDEGYVIFFKVSQLLAAVLLVGYALTDRLRLQAVGAALLLVLASTLFLIDGFGKGEDVSFTVVSVVDFVILGIVCMVVFVGLVVKQPMKSDVVNPMVAVAWFYVGLAYVYLVKDVFFWNFKYYGDMYFSFFLGSKSTKIEDYQDVSDFIADIVVREGDSFPTERPVMVADFDLPLVISMALFAITLLVKYLYRDIQFLVSIGSSVLIFVSSYFIIDARSLRDEFDEGPFTKTPSELLFEGGFHYVVFIIVPLLAIYVDVKNVTVSSDLLPSLWIKTKINVHFFAAALGAVTIAVAFNNLFNETVIFEGKFHVFDDPSFLGIEGTQGLSFTKLSLTTEEEIFAEIDCRNKYFDNNIDVCINEGYIIFFKVSQWIAGVTILVYALTDRLRVVAGFSALVLAVASTLFLIEGFQFDDVTNTVVSVVEFMVLSIILTVGFVGLLLYRPNESDVVNPMVALAWFYVGLAYVYLVKQVLFWSTTYYSDSEFFYSVHLSSAYTIIDFSTHTLFGDIENDSIPKNFNFIPMAIVSVLFAGALMFKYLYRDIRYIASIFATVVIVVSSYFVFDAKPFKFYLSPEYRAGPTTLAVEGGIHFVVFLVLVPLAVIWLDVKGNSSDYKFLGI